MSRQPVPLVVHIGPYLIDVQLVAPGFLREGLGLTDQDEVDGWWDNQLGASRLAGHIYINDKLSLKMQWKTFLHELQHAMIDLHDWDGEN